MRYQELAAQIDEGKIQPLYFFHGEEGFLIEEAIKKLKRAILTAGFEDFNYHLLSGPSIQTVEMMDLCLTLPVFSKGRLVVVREVEGIPNSEGLIPYLENPSDSTCLVMVAGKVDQRKRLFLSLKSKATEVVFSPLSDSQIKPWMKQIAKSAGLQLPSETLDYLQERLGNDLYEIRNELEKLALAGTGTQPPGVEEIQVLLSGERDHSVFEWLDAVRNRHHEKALQLLNLLLDSGEHPLPLLGLLLKHLRRSIVQDFPARGGQPSSTRREEDLIQALALCLEADSKLKGSRLSPQLILEDLVLGICGKGNLRGAGTGLRGRLGSGLRSLT